MTTIAGAHAVVTGGSSGIGRATASLLVRRGARVSLLARNRDRLEQAAGAIRAAGGRVETASVDVSESAGVDAAIAQVTEVLGPCDILVTSAGIAHPGYFDRLDESVFRELMEVDYFGTLHPVRAVVPSMIERRRGSIVGISSAAGLIGLFGYTAYSPPKFAVLGLFESLRCELAPHGIHIGCALPPDVDTPQLEAENRLKPPETAAITGAIRPLPAERVAADIVSGIERERFWIVSGTQTRLLARLKGLVRGALASSFDRKVRAARRGGSGT